MEACAEYARFSRPGHPPRTRSHGGREPIRTPGFTHTIPRRPEIEGAALVAKRVEQDLDAVVGVQAGVPSHLRPDDAAGLGVVGQNADVEVALVVQESHFRSFRGDLPGFGLALNQITDLRRRAPDRLVQHAVDGDGLRGASDGGGSRRRPSARRRRRGRILGSGRLAPESKDDSPQEEE